MAKKQKLATYPPIFSYARSTPIDRDIAKPYSVSTIRFIDVMYVQASVVYLLYMPNREKFVC